MLPLQLMTSDSDARYYSRGQDEVTLENEARALVAQGFTEKPTANAECLPGLTLYDMFRRPLPIVEDRKITLDIKSLNSDFTCPICLGILKETMTAMDCMHRFCGECIVTCLRLSNKECPTCRTKCGSKRNLRRDTAFDELVKAVYPDVEELERKEEEIVSKINRSFDREAHRKSVEEGLKRQLKATGADAPSDDPELHGNDDDDDDDDDDNSPPYRADQDEVRVTSRPLKKPKSRRPTPIVAAWTEPTQSPSLPRERERVEIILQRHQEEKALQELALPALVVPREVTISTLEKLVRTFASPDPSTEGQPIIFTVFVRGFNRDLRLAAADSIALILTLAQDDQIPVLRYQTQVLADALGFEMRPPL